MGIMFFFENIGFVIYDRLTRWFGGRCGGKFTQSRGATRISEDVEIISPLNLGGLVLTICTMSRRVARGVRVEVSETCEFRAVESNMRP